MAKFADRVKVTVDSSTSGTGAVTLSTAVSGYQAVPSALDGASIRYVIELGTAWEIGLGVYTHSTLNLTRSLTSSSTGSLLSLNNTAIVFISPAAEDLQYVEVYSSTSDLPSASSNHGRIAHVHGDGAMYFAHAGNWVRLGNHSDITSYTLPTASASTLGGIKIGSGLSIDGSGVVTASGGSGGIALTDLSVTQNSASGSGALSYDNTSGVFSYTPPASLGAADATNYSVTSYTASAGSNTFDASSTPALPAYQAGKLAVYVNGVLRPASEYTATNGTSVVMTLAANDEVSIVNHGAASGGSGVTTYANKAAIDAVPSPSEGDLAFDEDKNVLYIRAGSAWERIQHGGNVGPQFTTTPASTLILSSGSTSTITAVAVDENGFPVTYDWDGISGSTVYTASSLPDQVTNVSESNGVFTLTPSTNSSHAGTFTFRTKASDGAQVSTATTNVSLVNSTDITTPNASPFTAAGTNTISATFTGATVYSGAGFSGTLDTGKKYFEVELTSNASYVMIGIAPSDWTTSSQGYNTSGNVSINGSTGNKFKGNVTTNLSTVTQTGEYFMFAYDTSTREVWVGTNGSWYEDPATTSSSYLCGSTGDTTFALMVSCPSSTGTSFTADIITGGSGTFNSSIPSGFSAH